MYSIYQYVFDREVQFDMRQVVHIGGKDYSRVSLRGAKIT